MDWKNFLKKAAIVAGVTVATVGVAAYGWQWATVSFATTLATNVAKAAIVVGAAAFLGIMGKLGLKTSEKTQAPVVVNVNPGRENTRQREYQNEHEQQNTQVKEEKRPQKRRFLGRNPARLIARWHTRNQQKENQREAA